LNGAMQASPNGQFLVYPYSAYTQTTPGRHYAIVRIADGSTVKVFDQPEQGFDCGPVWSPDSRSLEYVETINGASNLWEHSIEGGPSQQLTKFTTGLIFNFSWSSDGQRLYFARGDVTNDVVLLTGLK